MRGRPIAIGLLTGALLGFVLGETSTAGAGINVSGGGGFSACKVVSGQIVCSDDLISIGTVIGDAGHFGFLDLTNPAYGGGAIFMAGGELNYNTSSAHYWNFFGGDITDVSGGVFAATTISAPEGQFTCVDANGMDAGPGPVYAAQFCTASGCASTLGGNSACASNGNCAPGLFIDGGVTAAAVDGGALVFAQSITGNSLGSITNFAAISSVSSIGGGSLTVSGNANSGAVNTGTITLTGSLTITSLAAGSCSISGGTTCTATTQGSTPHQPCFVTPQGASPLTFSCSCDSGSSTTTVTCPAATTATFNVFAIH